jgi:hypothetical protein
MASSPAEVRMSTRLVFVLLIFLAIPVCSQQSIGPQTQQRIWARGQGMRPDSPPELDTRAARLQALHHDAAALSTLSVSLQSDLAQLQKGMLAKDLAQKLKQVEKLSKKVRQEMAP